MLAILLFALVALSAEAKSRAEQILAEIANPKSDYVVVIAHRSDWRHYPENSLAAMEGAIAMGVDMLRTRYCHTIATLSTSDTLRRRDLISRASHSLRRWHAVRPLALIALTSTLVAT